jgi:hypothetical protein
MSVFSKKSAYISHSNLGGIEDLGYLFIQSNLLTCAYNVSYKQTERFDYSPLEK